MRDLVGELRKRLPELRLSADDLQDVTADVATVEAQLASSRPKRAVVHAALGGVKSVLERATVTAAASELLAGLHHVLASLGVGG